MDEQPSPGVDRTPRALPRHVLEERERFPAGIPEQEKPKALAESVLEPTDLGTDALVASIRDAADPALGQVPGIHDIQGDSVSVSSTLRSHTPLQI